VRTLESSSPGEQTLLRHHQSSGIRWKRSNDEGRLCFAHRYKIRHIFSLINSISLYDCTLGSDMLCSKYCLVSIDEASHHDRHRCTESARKQHGYTTIKLPLRNSTLVLSLHHACQNESPDRWALKLPDPTIQTTFS
jgi:hypothetical protein